MQTNRIPSRPPGRYWRAALAGFALLAVVSAASGQVAVQTIGGGPRVGCGPSAGFAGGNTYRVAQFNQPYAAALDAQGNLWIADRANADVEQVTQAGNTGGSLTIEYAAGSNRHPFPNVIGVAVDSANNLYVLTTKTLDVYQDVVATYPTLYLLLPPIELSRVSAGPATAIAVANDANTNIYISFTNSSGGTIIRIPQPYTGAYSTVVDNYSFAPAGLALRQDGLLAVTDTLHDGIYLVSNLVTSGSSSVGLLTGGSGPGFENGPANLSKFNKPHGIAASADGRMVVCDTGNNYLRLIDTTGLTTTLYGTPSSAWTATCCSCDPALYAGWVDGPAGNTVSNASGRQPVGVTISSNGTLFVTELYYSLIRSVTGIVPQLNPVTFPGSTSSSTNLPALVTGSVTNISANGATLLATLDPNGIPVTYYFQWWTNLFYTNNYTAPATLSASTNLDITNTVSSVLSVPDLLPNTVIFYQAVANNSNNTVYGGIRQFETAAGPNATTLMASNITSTNATLNGTINSEGAASSYYFEWGANTSYGNFSATNTLTTNLNGAVAVAVSATNLPPDALIHFQLVAFNSLGTNVGGDVSFTTLAVPPVFFISPGYGYFPECQTITVTSSIPNIYYTEDGTTPTVNSAQVVITQTNTGPPVTYLGAFQWCNPYTDLSALQMIAVSNGAVSATLTGAPIATNQLGFARSPFAGIGSTAFIPIVLNLQSNYQVQSLLFRVEVTPAATVPSPSSLSLLPVSSNDFVQFIGGNPDNTPVTFSATPYAAASNGLGLVVSTQGSGSGLSIKNFGVVGLLSFQIPGTAGVSNTYTLNILYPSGTYGGYTDNIPMSAMSPQILTVADFPYLVGDSEPAYGYDAGEFGDGILNDADFNAILFASMGIRVPPVESDIYNAMCVMPQTPNLNGNGVITYADWNAVMQRAVGLENNWTRIWTPGGSLFGTLVPIPGGLPGYPAVTNNADVVAEGSPPGLVWFCPASLGAGTVTNVRPGQICSLPVHLNVLPGYSLSGFQFRAIVSPNGNAPPVGQVTYNPAGAVATNDNLMSLPGLSENDILAAWPLNAFDPPLQNSNDIGAIRFQIPASAQTGQSYAVHFQGVDGAPDETTDYAMESFPGYAWVGGPAQQPASITSDEWKLRFFGSLTNSAAGDDVDADGDGALNWQEYLAGTDPTKPESVLRFGSAGLLPNGVSELALSWLTAPGKTYVLETTPLLGGGNWTPINTNVGNGYNYQFIQTKLKQSGQFYRIVLQP